jgi:hypothetical protein
MSQPNDHVVYWEFTQAQYNALMGFITDHGADYGVTGISFQPFNGKYYLEQTPGNIAAFDMLFMEFDEFDGMPGGDEYGFGTQSWVPSQVPPVLRP